MWYTIFVKQIEQINVNGTDTTTPLADRRKNIACKNCEPLTNHKAEITQITVVMIQYNVTHGTQIVLPLD